MMSPQHHQDFQQGDRTPDCEEIRRWRKEKTVVQLNVGGERHEVRWRLLEGQPRSRLGLLALATTADQVGFISTSCSSAAELRSDCS